MKDASRDEVLLNIDKEGLLEKYMNVKFYNNLLLHDVRNVFQVASTTSAFLDAFMERHPAGQVLESTNENLKIAIRRGVQLLETIQRLNNIDDFAERKKIDALNVLHEVIDYVSRVHDGEDIAIRVDHGGKDALVEGNDLLHDAFENILANGIVHNDSDRKEISIEIQGTSQEGEPAYKFGFIDNGIGISDQQARLLLKDRSIPSRKGRTGLGLHLVHAIVDHLGGELLVRANSRDAGNDGTTLVVVLPACSKEPCS